MLYILLYSSIFIHIPYYFGLKDNYILLIYFMNLANPEIDGTYHQDDHPQWIPNTPIKYMMY